MQLPQKQSEHDPGSSNRALPPLTGGPTWALPNNHRSLLVRHYDFAGHSLRMNLSTSVAGRSI